VDVVFVTAMPLLHAKKPFNANIHYSPHGVNVEHFNRALNPALPVPAELRDLPRPIVAFHGLIGEWVDLDLIEYLAQQRPAWSFVLIGKSAVALDRLQRFPNIHWLGPVDYDRLPEYCRLYDCSLIPFVRSHLTEFVNPLKIREYLAAGRPVVTAGLPEVEPYRGVAHLADTPEEYLREIELALQEQDAAHVATRVETVKNDSWEARLETVSEILEDCLRRKWGR
jgi:glycosyltransferase involved in cell wall biosynthesis